MMQVTSFYFFSFTSGSAFWLDQQIETYVIVCVQLSMCVIVHVAIKHVVGFTAL